MVQEERVIISGYGAVTPAGGAKEFRGAIWSQTPFLKKFEDRENCAFLPHPVPIATVPDELIQQSLLSDPEYPLEFKLAALAVEEVLKNSNPKIENKKNCGFVMGMTTLASSLSRIANDPQLLKNISSLAFSDSLFWGHMLILLAARFGLGGFVETSPMNCAGGVESLRMAMRLLKSENVSFTLAGASECFSQPAHLQSMMLAGQGVVSFFSPDERPIEKSIIPFGRMNLSNGGGCSDGSVFLCLENEKSALERGLKPRVSLELAESYFYPHQYDPLQAMGDWVMLLERVKEKLVARGLLEKLQHCVLPVTGMFHLDMILYKAVHRVFGPLHVLTVEPLFGHPGSVASLYAALAGIMTIEEQNWPQTYNVNRNELDFNFKLKLVEKNTPMEIPLALTLGEGMGGQHTALVFSHYAI